MAAVARPHTGSPVLLPRTGKAAAAASELLHNHGQVGRGFLNEQERLGPPTFRGDVVDR
jgi:hypothetical protein